MKYDLWDGLGIWIAHAWGDSPQDAINNFKRRNPILACMHFASRCYH